MPRITPVVVAALLLGVSLFAKPALAQPSLSTTTSERAGSTRPSTPPMPLQLFKRGDSKERDTAGARTAGARYGKPIEFSSSKNGQAGDKLQKSEGGKTTSGNVTSVVFSSLAIVLGLFFVVVWLARRALPKSTMSLPSDVLEVLGRSPLANRHHLQLIRLGRRLLLVSVSPDSAETLTEITDPDEVNHLASLCQQDQPGSITGSFRQVLHQLGSQQPSRSRRARAEQTDSDTAAPATRRSPLRNSREAS